VHRDIKPRNVLLDRSGAPRLTDFGLARELDSAHGLSRSGAVLGTPGYMAPEQVEPRLGPFGPLIDLHALGATLYFMLTGRPPFQAASDAEVLRHVVERDPTPPRILDDAVRRDLDTICRTCLEKRPERRYATAAELAADLGRFLDGRPIRARRLGPLDASWRWARRRPGLAAGAMTVAAMLAATAIGGLVVAYHEAQLLQVADAEGRHAHEREAVARRNLLVAFEALEEIVRLSEVIEQSTPQHHRLNDACRRQIRAIGEAYLARRPPGVPWISAEVRMVHMLAGIRLAQGRKDDGLQLHRRALELGHPLLRAHPGEALLGESLAGSGTVLAQIQFEALDLKGLLPWYEQAYRDARVISPAQAAGLPRAFYVRSMAAGNVSGTYASLGRFQEAAVIQAEALEFSRRTLELRPNDPAVAVQVAEHLIRLASLRMKQGSFVSVAALLDEAGRRLSSVPAGSLAGRPNDLAGMLEAERAEYARHRPTAGH
jgi:hypothetical protein